MLLHVVHSHEILLALRTLQPGDCPLLWRFVLKCDLLSFSAGINPVKILLEPGVPELFVEGRDRYPSVQHTGDVDDPLLCGVRNVVVHLVHIRQSGRLLFPLWFAFLQFSVFSWKLVDGCSLCIFREII